MSAELMPLLTHSTVLLSLALLGVFALRGFWLRCFGAGNVLLLWLSVPATLLALFVPAPVRVVEGRALTMTTIAAEAAMPFPALPGQVSEPAVTIDGSGLLLALWLVGAVIMSAVLTLRQWRYRRSLGRLEALPDGSFRGQFNDTGPALVGALRPRIVVPANFEQRYTPQQQSLILAHERCHLRRGDAQFTLLGCLIRCLFWFNPLVHLAWSRFRIDQELACDAIVLRKHPGFRRDYAEAMVSTQYSASQLPVGCTWQTGDPLRRRITMMYTHRPGNIQLLIGTVMALGASTAAAVGAWSSQEPQLRFLSAGAPSLEFAAASAPVAPEPTIAATPAKLTVPSLASISARHAPDVQAKLAPPAPAAAAETAPSPATAPAPASAPAPTSARTAAPDAAPSPAPEAAPPSDSEATTVPVQHARLVEASRPSFPSSFNKPKLVIYPGMPESEQPSTDWQPDGRISKMQVRVTLDENGEPVDAAIAENNVNSGRMVRYFERVALRAVKNWRYEPARIDGEAVPSQVVLAFYFETDVARLSPNDIEHPYRDRTPVFPQSVSRNSVRVNGIAYSR